MTTPRRIPAAFWLVVVAYALWAGVYIAETSFVAGGERYFSLTDEAMVSMRYARNLASGQGLVWNPGEDRVEGFTSPLWALFMALLHLIPFPPSMVSVVVQATGALLMVANLYVVRRISEDLYYGSGLISQAAVVLTAFYLPLDRWTLQGTEVGLLALLVSVSVWLASRAMRGGAFSIRPYLLMGIATLARLDAAVALLAMTTFLALADGRNRLRHLATGVLTLVGFVGAQTALRWWYYGDVLPNAYYLDMAGCPAALRLGRGLGAIGAFAAGTSWAALLVLVASARYFRRDRSLVLIMWMFVAHAGYDIWAGGDAPEWWGGADRYLAPAMPVFFVLFAGCLYRVLRPWFEYAFRSGDRRLEKRDRALRLVMPVLAVMALLQFNSFGGRESLRELALAAPPIHRDENARMARTALLVRDGTTPEARVAVTRPGVLPYFAGRPAVDLLGMNDRVLARSTAVRTAARPAGRLEPRPVCARWNYAYSIGELRPDLVIAAPGSLEDARPHLGDYTRGFAEGLTIYLRRNSPHVRWDRVSARDPAGESGAS